jgi:hypothetical protein
VAQLQKDLELAAQLKVTEKEGAPKAIKKVAHLKATKEAENNI